MSETLTIPAATHPEAAEQRRLLLLFASALKALSIYPPGHPGIEQTLVALFRSLLKRLNASSQVSLVFLKDEVAVGNIPEGNPGAEVKRLAASLSAAGINRLTFRKGLAFEELSRFIALLREKTRGAAGQLPKLAHIGVEQLAGEEGGGLPEGAAGLTGAASCLYDTAMLSLKEILTSEETFGAAHLKLARDIVSGIITNLDSDTRLVEALYFLRQHDDYTLTHAINVCGLTVAQARALGLAEPTVAAIGIGALLHDVGKQSVPQELLTKQGRLSEAEFEVIKTHPLHGARHLCLTAGLPDIVPLIAAEHHLRYDTQGYPRRRGSRTPNLGSQLVQLADVYDALRTDRPYRRGKTLQETLAIMVQGRGTEFHPLLLQRFGRLITQQAELVGREAEAALILAGAGPGPSEARPCPEGR